MAILTVAKINSDIAEYEALLDSKASENAVHAFLASHSYFFNGFMALLSDSPLYSKIRLGSEYVTDFTWVLLTSFGPEWRLVEIEAPEHRIFRADGDFSAALNHAVQQVRDWVRWCEENISTARSLMPAIQYPMGFVFIGRQSELATQSARDKLRQLNYQNRNYVQVRTLDSLAGAAASVKNLVTDYEDETREWELPIPMNALSHADLARGLPEEVREALRHPVRDRLLAFRSDQRNRVPED
jgi:hypothetical protein